MWMYVGGEQSPNHQSLFLIPNRKVDTVLTDQLCNWLAAQHFHQSMKGLNMLISVVYIEDAKDPMIRSHPKHHR